ncbi:hypothetical protein D3C80_1109170 [compost metagenome]
MASCHHDAGNTIFHRFIGQCRRWYDTVIDRIQSHSLQCRCTGHRHVITAGSIINGQRYLIEAVGKFHDRYKSASECKTHFWSEIRDKTSSAAGTKFNATLIYDILAHKTTLLNHTSLRQPDHIYHLNEQCHPHRDIYLSGSQSTPNQPYPGFQANVLHQLG